MKKTLTRSIFIFILTLAFFGGLALFTFRICVNANDWIQQNFNGHISGSGGLEKAGKIFDRNGSVMAQSIDGQRYYHEDYTTRLATLHIVGDNSLNISTAVQSTYRSEILGFNYIWGLEMPQSFRGGNNLTLTIDSAVCKAAYEALNGKRGAVVVLNYQTGEVLCNVSSTTYDPQDPPEITEENEEEYNGAYLNRALSSSYTPGSIFKLVTAAAAIDNIPDIFDRTFTCNGGVVLGGEEISCLSDHGTISFQDGLAQSCNVVFAELAVELGKDKMTQQATQMGINASFDVGNAPTVEGKYDVSKASENELGWSGIGQYTDLANPMQMAILMSAIATDGTAVEPYFVSSVSSADFSPVRAGSASKGQALLSESTAQTLSEMMRYTVTSNYGDSMFPSLEICAKTGTAEVSDDEDGKNDAWIVGFSRDEDAPLAFAVVVEDGEFGYSTAGPVAVAAMEAAAQALRSAE